jgi:hypothetical protein
MVMFAVLEEAKAPVRRPLNASFEDDAGAGFAGGSLGFELVEDGVMGRELGAELPAEESIEKTSCCGLLGCKLLLVADPSFCGGGVGLIEADEFHSSANESAMCAANSDWRLEDGYKSLYFRAASRTSRGGQHRLFR